MVTKWQIKKYIIKGALVQTGERVFTWSAPKEEIARNLRNTKKRNKNRI